MHKQQPYVLDILRGYIYTHSYGECGYEKRQRGNDLAGGVAGRAGAAWV
jgi:hypothetical protein